MSLYNLHRMFETDDEDLKVTQIFAIRIFNALGSALKLTLGGYHQNSAMIMRDILETNFLLDLFAGDPSLISLWRQAKSQKEKSQSSPVAVRLALDTRHGNTSEKRKERYKFLCEIAAHPTMQSDLMLRPNPDAGALIGPYMEKAVLAPVLTEMATLAGEAGTHLVRFMPKEWEELHQARINFNLLVGAWLREFSAEINE